MLEKLDLQVKGSLPTLLSVKNEKLHKRVIVLNIYPSAMAKNFGLLKIFWNSKHGFCWEIPLGHIFFQVEMIRKVLLHVQKYWASEKIV